MLVQSHRESIIVKMTIISLLSILFSILALAEYSINSEYIVAKRWKDSLSVSIPLAIVTGLIAWYMLHNNKYHRFVSVPV
jgi:uncharacterized membrane protein (DUF485 family)